MEEAVFIKMIEDRIYIRARGHVTAALCPELKTRSFERLDTAPPVRAIYLDLSECEYMDSTFLGFIVGINKRLERLANRKIVLLGVNPTCFGLLRTIGVTKLVEISEEKIPFPGSLERIGRGPEATADFLLDAHEELSSLSEENRERFATLTSILRDALKKPPHDN